jgi:hypothetical protein
MNRIASTQKSFADQPISPALRCVKAIDEIEQGDYTSDDDEVALLVQFSDMIAAGNPTYIRDA